MQRIKINTYITGSFVLLVGLFFSVPAEAKIPWLLSNGEVPTLAPMLEKVTPAVVRISTRGTVASSVSRNPFFGQRGVPQKQTRGLGSGVIVDAEKGFIVTNHHVIEGSDDITVTLKDGRALTATLVGSDPEVDIAVLKIEAKNLTGIPFADSTDLRVGDFVVAIGTPFGLTQTVTSGIVSALGRNNLDIESYENFIQTDASINQGNSGGALINLKGELVGINTAILGPGGGSIGIGFAIPMNMVTTVTDQLLEYGEVRRGKLGVGIQDMNAELAESFLLDPGQKGAAVSLVEEGSPAAEAGIMSMDVIIGVNGKRVSSASDLRNQIGLLRAGSAVVIELLRNGGKKTIKLNISSPLEEKLTGNVLSDKLEGVTFGNHDGKGIVVTAILPGSSAASSGLVEGDIVLSINRQALNSVEALNTSAVSNQNQLLLNIVRNGFGLFLLIQ